MLFKDLKIGELFTLFTDSTLVYKKDSEDSAQFSSKKDLPKRGKQPKFGIKPGLEHVVYKAT